MCFDGSTDVGALSPFCNPDRSIGPTKDRWHFVSEGSAFAGGVMYTKYDFDKETQLYILILGKFGAGEPGTVTNGSGSKTVA